MSKYIDADRLIETLNKEKVPFNDDVNYFILNAPAADVQEVKHGRWRKERVSSTGYGSYGVYQCSICGAMFPDIGYGYDYCPNCGAKMDEVEE